MDRHTFLQSLNPDKHNKPSFSVNLNGATQTNITGADKILWDTEVFDTNNNFDPVTNNRFTPTIAGKYLLSSSIIWTAVSAADALHIYIFKNGAEYVQSLHIAHDSSDVATGVTVVVDANGTTDYFEIFAQNDVRNSSDIIGLANRTYFSGCKVD